MLHDEKESSLTSFDLKYKTLGKTAIGEGGQAKVFLCKNMKEGDVYVLKEIHLRPSRPAKDSAKQLAQLHRELEIHMSISNPHIVKCVEYFESKDSSKIQIILEYCSEGDLMDYIERKPQKRLEEADTKKIIHQVALALQYLHGRKMIHRDIKPENILLSSVFDSSGFPISKISDFGISKELKGTVGHTYTGSPIYMAPEITMNESENQYGYPADLWSLGVTLYALLFGGFPELDENFTFQPNKGKGAAHWAGLSEDVRDLICGLIRPNPAERLTVEQVLACKWLADVDYEVPVMSRRQSLAPP